MPVAAPEYESDVIVADAALPANRPLALVQTGPAGILGLLVLSIVSSYGLFSSSKRSKSDFVTKNNLQF
jgi:hypothetical protein